MEFPLLSDVLGAESPVTELQCSGSLESVPRVSCTPRLHRSRGGWAARPSCASVSWGRVPPSSPFCLQPPSVSIRVVVPAGFRQLWAQPRFLGSGAWWAWGLSSPRPSWAPPSFPLPSLWSGAQAWGPSLCWGRASPPSWVSAPLLPGGLGVPTLRVPHLSPAQAPAVAWGRSWGVGEGQCRWSPEATLEDAVLNCLRGCVLVGGEGLGWSQAVCRLPGGWGVCPLSHRCELGRARPCAHRPLRPPSCPLKVPVPGLSQFPGPWVCALRLLQRPDDFLPQGSPAQSPG